MRRKIVGALLAISLFCFLPCCKNEKKIGEGWVNLSFNTYQEFLNFYQTYQLYNDGSFWLPKAENSKIFQEISYSFSGYGTPVAGADDTYAQIFSMPTVGYIFKMTIGEQTVKVKGGDGSIDTDTLDFSKEISWKNSIDGLYITLGEKKISGRVSFSFENCSEIEKEPFMEELLKAFNDGKEYV